MTLLASRDPARRPGRGGAAGDPLAAFGRAAAGVTPSRTAADAGLGPWVGARTGGLRRRALRLPGGARCARAQPQPLVVTVHDVAWRRHPDATTPRGRRWHEAALRPGPGTRGGAGRSLPAGGRRPGRLRRRRRTASPSCRAAPTTCPHPTRPPPTPSCAAVGVPGEFLLTVGTLEPRKNLERLVRAFARAPALAAGAVAAGRRGADGLGPGSAPGAAGRGRRLHRVPWPAPVLAGLYRRARAFAYVPLTEGYGLPPLEAMRDGDARRWSPPRCRACTTSAHRARHPRCIVDPLDVDDIAAGLAAVLTDDALRADLAAAGRRPRPRADVGRRGTRPRPRCGGRWR